MSKTKNMLVELKSCSYKKSEPRRVVRGVKNNKTPYGAVKGGNGSFVVAGSPVANIVVRSVDDNNWTTNVDIGWQIRQQTQRLTEKKANEIFAKLKSEPFYIQQDEINGEWSVCNFAEVLRRE